MQAQTHLNDCFKGAYGQSAELTSYAPGRVNLIGDHTDYNDGFVLPAAINFGTSILASKRTDRLVKVIAIDINNEQLSFDLDDVSFDDSALWSNYIRGSLIELMSAGEDIQGANLLISGNVPQGAGLSSSASFEIAILKTFADLYQLSLSGIDAAKMGQGAENNFVGCNCGIMDQLISALGKKSHAMLLDCRTLTYNYAKIPTDMTIMVVNSNVKRELVASEYNTRREQCEQVAKFFNKSALRDVTLSQLEASKSDIEDQLYRRARHVISENERTIHALTALNDNDMPTLSRLMAQSHASLKDDFEVTVPELDILVEILSAVLGNRGGTRMTGGGFGGCVVALMPKALVEQANNAVLEQYQVRTNIKPDVYICTAEQGAFTA
ncbi:MAG: galactokinase [Colwellia sp.]|nr:galactokinase [Colwellia sp.]